MNALIGGGAFLLAPDGHLLQMPISHVQKTPFSDFLIPGALLFTFLGVYPIFAAISLWMKPAWRWPEVVNPFRQSHWSRAASLTAGLIAMIWIIVQVQWIPIGFLHIFVFIWGAAILGVTLLPDVYGYSHKNV